MADTNLHIAEAPTKPALHEDLQRMAEYAIRMEEALRGVAGSLRAISAGGMLDSLPKDEADRPNHEAATSILRLMENHVTDVLEEGCDWDLSCELVGLASRAREGRLIRYGKLNPEG